MKPEFFASFGRLTCSFARMEAALRTLVAGIAFQGSNSLAAAFLDSLQLNQTLKILKKVSREFWDDDESKIKEINSRISQLREKRNLFIHGIWDPSDFEYDDGSANVCDLNSKFEPHDRGKSWEYGFTESFTSLDFNDLGTEVEKIIDLIETTKASLSKSHDIQFSYPTGYDHHSQVDWFTSSENRVPPKK